METSVFICVFIAILEKIVKIYFLNDPFALGDIRDYLFDYFSRKGNSMSRGENSV